MQAQTIQQEATGQVSRAGQQTAIPEKKSKWWKWLIIVIVVIAILAGIYFWLF